MTRLSAQVHKLIDELDEAADSQTASRSKSNRIGCVGSDFFIGIKVAEIREVAERYVNICLDEIEQLLLSEVHEHRMCALIILKKRFKQGNEYERTEIFEFYINHTNCINDWDLIDSSSPYIVGEYLHDKPCDVLYRLAQSDSPWDNRIAMMATYTFIHNGVSVSAILSCRPFFILIFLLCIKMKHYGFSRKSIWKNLETFP